MQTPLAWPCACLTMVHFGWMQALACLCSLYSCLLFFVCIRQCTNTLVLYISGVKDVCTCVPSQTSGKPFELACLPQLMTSYQICCMPWQHVCLLQIYVEIERARLTRQLAQMQEQDGKISEAADTLQEIAVVRECSSWFSSAIAVGHKQPRGQPGQSSHAALDMARS